MHIPGVLDRVVIGGALPVAIAADWLTGAWDQNGGGYVVGGLGATFFSPGLGGLSDEIRPSANVGVGWQWPLARNVALRTELRGYLTLINSSGQFFCSGGCVVSIRGNTVLQAEAMVGMSIGF